MMSSVCLSVMVCCFLAGMKLTFLIYCMVLYFGFVMKTMSITHQCFSCYWAVLTQHHGISLHCSVIKEVGVGAEEAGRWCHQDSFPSLTRGVSHTVWLCAQQWIQGEGCQACHGLGTSQLVVHNCIVRDLLTCFFFLCFQLFFLFCFFF